MRVHRAIAEQIRPRGDWDAHWGTVELGLISSWERGREMRLEAPPNAEAARNGQLIVLPWKGGVEKELKKTKKFGVFNYLAMWQGLRAEDLNIDPEVEVTLTCSVTKMAVTFTSDFNKYATL